MDDPQERPESGEPMPPAPSPPRVEHENVGWRFEQAYQRYMVTLQEAQVDSQRGWAEANRDYVNAVQNTWLETQRRFSEANQRYAAAAQDAWWRENPQGLVTEPYRDYVRALREACDETQKQYREASGRCTEQLRRATTDVQGRWEQAYQNYLTAVEEAWDAAEAGVLDVHALAAISYGIATSTPFASNTIGLSPAGQEK